MLNKIKRASHKAYTLIELLVGISIFMILIAASAEFFVSSLEMQQRALLSQRLLDNVSYTLEYMNRAIRMAQKDADGKCITANKSYESTRSGNGIKFLNYRDECWEFYWSAPDAQNKRGLIVGMNNQEYELTSEFLDVSSFKIVPNGWDEGEGIQPRVTLFLEAKMIKNNKPELQPSIKIQTTISQRNLEE